MRCTDFLVEAIVRRALEFEHSKGQEAEENSGRQMQSADWQAPLVQISGAVCTGMVAMNGTTDPRDIPKTSIAVELEADICCEGAATLLALLQAQNVPG